MKILVTGAHFTPAVAVIEELKKFRDLEIIYVGRKTTLEGDSSQSIESKILPSRGVKFIPIITGRLQRFFTIYTIPSLLKIPIGFIQAIYIIFTQKPDVVLSFGGYVAVPVVIAGWLFSIPIIVHEQTLVSGLANKISAVFADKIALSFKGDQRFNGSQMIVTGNPIRREILHPEKFSLPDNYQKIFSLAKKEKLPFILIMGGNQGSHTINKTVEKCLSKLTKMACIIHISGDNKFGDFERLERLGEFGGRYFVKKWIGKEYGVILSKVDLVISRAGANTLTELAYIGKPAMVIPFEPLYQDEQTKNARYFEQLGLVNILSQSKLSIRILLENVKFILNDLNHFNNEAKKARKVVIPDAAKRVALETILLMKSK